MTERSVPRTAVQLLLGWAASCAVLLGLGWLLTHSWAGSVGAWDDDVSRAVADRRTPGLDAVADLGAFVADTPVGAGFAAVAAVAIALWKRSWLPVLVLGLATAGAGALYELGTTLITRDRPPVVVLDPGLVPDHSFPSGHVGTAVAAYAGTLVVLWALSPRSRPWAWSLALVPLFVAVCRIYQGAHHVSDVVVTGVVVTAWLALVVRLVLVGGVSRRPGRHPSGPARGAPARA